MRIVTCKDGQGHVWVFKEFIPDGLRTPEQTKARIADYIWKNEPWLIEDYPVDSKGSILPCGFELQWDDYDDIPDLEQFEENTHGLRLPK